MVQGVKVLKRRRDVVFSQAVSLTLLILIFCKLCHFQLTGLVTSFYLTLSQHLVDNDFFEQVLQLGFLAQFTSLLSCHGMCISKQDMFTNLKSNCLGEEQSMLEDMIVVIQELRSVSFQVRIAKVMRCHLRQKDTLQIRY